MRDLKAYYYLTKPGIIRGNALAAAAGFLFAARGDIDFGLFLAAVGGLSLVIASACVFNNYFDRQIDSKMTRTSKRALVTGKISNRNALLYGFVLGSAGFGILGVFTTKTALLAAAVGFFFYVAVYTPAKKRTQHATLLGSISGSAPPVVGYTAVTGNFDPAALLLFIILAVWQMPHFYAIAIFRAKEYKAAAVPVLSLTKGVLHAKYLITLYIVAFIGATAALSIFGAESVTYLVAMTVAGLYWLWVAVSGFDKNTDEERWAKKTFGTSLLVLLAFSILISVDVWLS